MTARQARSRPFSGEPLFSPKALVKLFLFLILDQTLGVTIGMADTIMVTSVGEAAVSGISLVDSINNLLVQLFAALATGGAIVVSQYIGRRDLENGCRAAKQLIYAAVTPALCLTVLVILFRRPALRLIFGEIEPAVMASAEVYFLLTALSYPFLAAFNSGAALFRAMGSGGIPLATSLLMNFINVGGNAVLIYGFHWGAAGAGTATLLSRVAATVVILALICRRSLPVHIESLFRPEAHFSLVRSILRQALPNGIEGSTFDLGKLLVMRLVTSVGTAAIAANAIANSLAGLTNIPGAAMGLGLLTVVGQCVGARDYEQARYYVKRVMALVFLSMGLLSLLMLINVETLVGLFDLSPEASRQAVQVLQVFCLFSMFFWPPAFALPYALRAAGDSRFTMTASMVSMWLIRVGVSYLLIGGFHWGLVGAWLAMCLDWVLRAVLFVGRYLRGGWMKQNVID